MSKLTIVRVCGAILVIATALVLLEIPLLSHASSAAARPVFVTKTFRYSVLAPLKWNTGRRDGVAYFFNFSPRLIESQGSLPKHGADITIVPLVTFSGDLRKMTIDQWISRVVNGSPFGTRRIEHPAIRVDSSISEVTKVSFDSESEGRETERNVVYFFKLRTEAFESGLRFLKGDPRGELYESVLYEVVHSIKLLD